ncbi:MAG: acyltransferase [Longimicrobiales bacterium]
MRVEEALRVRGGACDGFRAIALLLLVVGHFAITWVPGADTDVVQTLIGYSIVMLFVVSGFTLTWALTREFDERGTIALRPFFLRKAVRLFPTLLAFAAVTSVHHTVNGVDVDALRVASIAGLLVNYYNALALGDLTRHVVGHLWSIAVGAQFVLAWTLLLRAGLRRGTETRLAVVLSVVIFTAMMLRAVVYPQFTGLSAAYIYNATETRVDEMALGALGALFLRIEVSRRALDRLLEVGWLPIALSLALVFSLSRPTAYANGFGHTIHAGLTVCLLMYALHRSEGRLARLFSTRPLIFISTISYSLFVWHLYGIALQPLFAGLPTLVELPLTVGVTIGGSWIAYLILERPFRRRAASWR